MAQIRLSVTVFLLPLIIAACTVGPNYIRPKVETPASYKELKGWKEAEPHDMVPRGAWWSIYKDSQLDGLEKQVNISNQNLKAAIAQYCEALDLVQEAKSAYYPTLTAGPTASRSRTSANFSPAAGAPGISTTSTDLVFSGTLSWELDLWGKVRREVESSKASAQASAADLEGVRLSAQAQLAQDYFQLRTLDSEKVILGDTVKAYLKNLKLIRNRYAFGVDAQAAIQTAQTELETTKAELIAIGVQRAQMEHAIAVLMGKAPSDLSIPPSPLAGPPPAVPAGVPSQLLERRPDIAAAERDAKAANAQIGVAIAAFYPTLTLSATGGFEASSLAKWFAWPSRFWTLGPASLQQTLFEGGLRQAQTAYARSTYDANVATYRQTVLAAFQQVEDELAALRIYEQQSLAQARAVNASIRNLDITVNQYKWGTASELDIVTSQTILLSNQLTAAEILGNRMSASVLLVEALGGGWTTADLPSEKGSKSP